MNIRYAFWKFDKKKWRFELEIIVVTHKVNLKYWRSKYRRRFGQLHIPYFDYWEEIK